MNFFRFAVLAILLAPGYLNAQTPTPSPTPAQPVPNTTNLRPLAGKYPAGRSQVTIETSPSYHGGCHLYATAPSDTALKIRLVGWVLTAAGRIPIDNQLTFLSSGAMKGRNLAPGIARSAPFTGIYTATGRRITFNGDFKFGDSTGTFTGTVQRNGKGRLFVVWSVSATGETQALYTYNYSATKPRR